MINININNINILFYKNRKTVPKYPIYVLNKFLKGKDKEKRISIHTRKESQGE